MTLPKSIRVGYRDYAVEEWASNNASAVNRFGECDRHNLTIKIRTDIPEALRAEVLIHEVIHAAYEMGAIEPTDHEERVVTILANQLTQVWRDNPGLISFMSAALRPR